MELLDFIEIVYYFNLQFTIFDSMLHFFFEHLFDFEPKNFTRVKLHFENFDL